ncbi:unnamed protein product [Musa acuminata subsp. malaccensis]|uniref:(wild Malaysian banana) hypothetical protein n=1 Tax=Musa acuminata subsp. malaccensis TaxID=214687 RepID=A0A804I051_MUSAM|nr:PREDICTED: F-box protein SKIP2-like [Musa acuminata subsp. malaccensis]CAG1861342.1 unnamed protein product [Musa acuminata subsp. malaccensis]
MGQSASSRLTDAPPAMGGVSLTRDYTAGLPDECLALVFQSLGSGDRKSCSLVCRRWLAVESCSRRSLSLDARAALSDVAPAIFGRFDGVSRLALQCGRRHDSIGDEALALVAVSFPGLVSLKLRACRALTVAGMEAIARHCPGLRELSVSSCTFGARGIDVVLRGCPLLEDLSIKRLRGLHDPSATADLVAGAASLRSLCLEDLYNGQCFAPFIAGSPNLKTLKLIRCSGDWDPLLQDIAVKVPLIVEIHLERLQVTDSGLTALSGCIDLEILRLVKTPECTDAGLATIADRCHRLRKLHIDGWKANSIGDVGLQAVAQRCTGLGELVLAGLDPTYRSLELIASNCGSLERLALCGSETIGDAEVACIASKCTSLKKLCIKECPVSDQGMEALAAGCPKLVKMTVKRCSGVTPDCADRLVASRHGKLAVNLEVNDGSTNDQQQEATEEGSALEEFGIAAAIGGSELPRPLVDGVGSQGRWPGKKKRAGFFATRRNLVASALRRLSHGSSNSSHSPSVRGEGEPSAFSVSVV